VYYASDYVDIKVCDTLVKELNVKKSLLDSIIQEKKKQKDAIRPEKQGSCKKDSLLNRKRCLFKRRLQ
jgi:hypothetical protein